MDASDDRDWFWGVQRAHQPQTTMRATLAAAAGALLGTATCSMVFQSPDRGTSTADTPGAPQVDRKRPEMGTDEYDGGSYLAGFFPERGGTSVRSDSGSMAWNDAIPGTTASATMETTDFPLNEANLSNPAFAANPSNEKTNAKNSV